MAVLEAMCVLAFLLAETPFIPVALLSSALRSIVPFVFPPLAHLSFLVAVLQIVVAAADPLADVPVPSIVFLPAAHLSFLLAVLLSVVVSLAVLASAFYSPMPGAVHNACCVPIRFCLLVAVLQSAVVSSAVLVSAFHLLQWNAEIVKRWSNEIQEAVQSKSGLVQVCAHLSVSWSRKIEGASEKNKEDIVLNPEADRQTPGGCRVQLRAGAGMRHCAC